MKNLIPVAALLLLALPAAAQPDIRIVAGRQVDLAPIHEYEAQQAQRTGTNSTNSVRPLAHWKKLEIVEFSTVRGTAAKCAAIIEGARKEIFLSNIPTPVAQRVAEEKKLGDEVKRLEAYVQTEGTRLRQLDAVTPKGDAFSVTEDRLLVNKQMDDLAEVKARQQKLSADYLAMQGDKAAKSEYAMNTGQKLGGFELWDCGVKR